MSRLRKQSEKVVEYDANPINPLGPSCVLLKCRDLYTLSISSISLFYEVLGNVENLKRLEINYAKLSKRILDVPSCGWLLLMVYASPYTSTLKVLEELVTVFSTARKLPKGLGVRGARGKAHLSPDDHASIVQASKEAIRMTLTLSGQVIKAPLELRSPTWLLQLKIISDDDVLQSALATNCLLYELEKNPKRMIISHELNNIVSALGVQVKKFEIYYTGMQTASNDLRKKNRDLVRSRRQFNAELYEVTHHENEANLDVPLEYYLKENDELRKLNDVRNKAKTAKDQAQLQFITYRGNFDVSFACVRALCLLVARSLSMYTGLYLDTTSLIPLGTDTVVPTTHSVTAALHPLVFGGNSTAADGNAAQREAIVNSLLRDIPWNKLASIAHIERAVSGTVSTRILAAIACKLSDCLQIKLASWAFRAMYDITHELRWYPISENMPDPEAIPSNGDRDFFRSLSVEEPLPPRFLYIKRQTTLDTRISTALAFWCMRGNRVVSSAAGRWKSLEEDGSRSQLRFLWSDIVRVAKSRSEIVVNEAEYWERVDPSRAFKEMDLRNTAVKMEELDEETSCSESDSDGDDDSKGSNDGDESDMEDQVGGGIDSEVPVEPVHTPLFKSIVNDVYAMAILHLTATEYPDETLDDFDLFRDSRSISIDSTRCARFIHQELYGHIDGLLKHSLEGPSDTEENRFNHPFQIVTCLIDQDETYTMADKLCEVDLEHIKYIISSCIGIKPGVVDVVIRASCLSILTSALSGTHPSYFNPSEAPMHCHTVASARKWRSELTEEISAQLRLYHKIRNMLSLVIEICADTFYKSTRADFVPCGENGRSFFSRFLRLFTAVANIDTESIKQQLSDAMSRLLATGDRFWQSHVPLSPENLWYAPFFITWQGGGTKLVGLWKRTRDWKRQVGVDDEAYGNSVYRCNMDISRCFSALMAVMCNADEDVCLFLAEYAVVSTEGMLAALGSHDRILNQHIYRIASCILNSAKEKITIGEKVTSTMSFDAPANYFRILLFQEGKGLDIACEMLMEVYDDVWGIDEKIKQESNNKPADLTSAKQKSGATLPPLVEGPSKKGGFGKLGGRSVSTGAGGSFDGHVSLPTVVVSVRGGTLEDDDEDIEASEQAERAGEGIEEEDDKESDEGEDNDSVDGVSILAIVSEWGDMLRAERGREAKDFCLFALESIFELVESRLELQDRVYDKSPGVFRSFYGLLTPKQRDQGSLEVENDDHMKGSGLSVAEDGTLSLGSFNPHMGVIGATARALGVLVKRHARIRDSVKNAGCVEGLMDALDMSYIIDDQVLGMYVVSCIEQLIIRNIDAWKFVKKAAGMKGLLQLCHMGNSAVRILASTEIITQIYPKHDRKIFAMTDEVLRHKGLATIIRMMHSSVPSVQTNAMKLLRTLCVNKLACRRAVLSPEFIAEIGALLFSPEVSVVRIACEVLLVLGAEDQYTLRQLVESMRSAIIAFDQYDTLVMDRYGVKSDEEAGEVMGLSIPTRLMDIANGILSVADVSESAFTIGPRSPPPGAHHPETITAMMDSSARFNTTYRGEILLTTPDIDSRLMQEVVDLANAAASVLASMTDGEEADWPDGGAPLRHTMNSTGLLPGLLGAPKKSTNILSYTL